jgi:hypothetical protein
MDHGLVNGDRADSAEIDVLRRKCLNLEEENRRLRSLLLNMALHQDPLRCRRNDQLRRLRISPN